MPRCLRWVFTAFIALSLVLAFKAELQQAKIYNQAKPVRADNTNKQFSGLPAAPGDKKRTVNEQQESNWYEIFLNRPTDWLLVLFNGILAAFTARLFYATDKQATEMQASIKASVDSATAAVASNQIAVINSEQQLRAYVTALDIKLVVHRLASTYIAGREIPGAAQTYQFVCMLKNGGQTPALNVKTTSDFKQFIGGVPAEFVFPDSGITGQGIIGPNTEWAAPAQLVGAGLIRPNTGINLLWGAVEYDDMRLSYHQSLGMGDYETHASGDRNCRQRSRSSRNILAPLALELANPLFSAACCFS